MTAQAPTSFLRILFPEPREGQHQERLPGSTQQSLLI